MTNVTSAIDKSIDNNDNDKKQTIMFFASCPRDNYVIGTFTYFKSSHKHFFRYMP